jgi:hypothetical protein
MDMGMFTEGMMSGPDGSILRFFYDSEKNEAASVMSGRAIFDTILYCDVITPGQKASTPRFEIERTFSEQSRDVTGNPDPSMKSYKYDEMREYVERFKANEQQRDLGGTPLKMWPRIDRGLQATLAASNIFTVEALAGLSDGNMTYLGLGARELREQAKEWLAAAAGSADTSKLVGEVDNLRVENERLQNSLKELNAKMTELTNRLGETGKLADII